MDATQTTMRHGYDLVMAERRRQVEVEGWSPSHDQGHEVEMENAAISYAVWGDSEQPPPMWPWSPEWWKPKDRLRNLVRAGALFQAAGEAVDLFLSMRYWGMRDIVIAEVDRLAADPSLSHGKAPE